MSTAFRRIQIGKESTRGTAVAADTVLIGSLTMTPEITWHRPVDERNSLAEFNRAVAVGQMTRLRYESDATYEQLTQFLSMAVKGGISTSTPGGATRDWTFIPNTTSKNVQDSFTFEYGDDTQAWESDFTVVESLELGLALNEVLTLRADMFANFAAKTTFTSGLSAPSLNGGEIVCNNAKIYIDSAWASLGGTEKATLLAGATIRVPTGLAPVKYADGSLDFSALAEQKTHAELEMDLVSSSAAITEYDAYVAGTTRAIRIEILGDLTGDSAFKYSFFFDVTGKYVTAPEIWGERDGEDIVRLALHSHEDSSGNHIRFTLRNKVTAI